MPSDELIIVKLGGAVITKKDEKIPQANIPVIKRLLMEIKDAKERKNFKIIIVHGAGSFGHMLAKKYSLVSGFKDENQIPGFVEVHLSVEKLNKILIQIFKEEKLPAFPFHSSSLFLLDDARISHCNLEAIKEAIDLGLVPVLYGDVALDKKRGFSIISGDDISCYLALKLKAKKLIMVSDVPGVFSSDPKRNENAKLLKELSYEEFERISFESKPLDVTGAMKNKVLKLFEVAKSGVECRIISGLEKNTLKETLLGYEHGTLIKVL